MTDEAPPFESQKIVQVRRPSPEQVEVIATRLLAEDPAARRPALVARLRLEIGCSRATAHRAINDFLRLRHAQRQKGGA